MTKYPSYKIKKEVEIEEISARLTHLEHEGCGAEVLHIGTEDPENLFCIAFRTLPTRSDGIAHILEHTVLCGSKHYPVRDPFFSMLRRSLNTFMNAMTGEDITFYPAASQVKADFYNLLRVYLDACFHPLLERQSFAQEGHRLEFAEADDPSTPLMRRGIVYNEMKGALASPEARAWQRMDELLYPQTPYRFNAGGEPKIIPQLTHDELTAFHRDAYDPSRALFFFYGSFPLEEHLRFLDENLLSQAQRLSPSSIIPHQPRFSHPLWAEDTYPQPPMQTEEDREMLLISWLTCSSSEPGEALALAALDSILMGSDAAPLKKSLLQTGWCSEVYSNLDLELADVPYLLFFRGCEKERAKEIEAHLLTTLETIAAEGIDPELITAALHQLAFDRLEIGDDGAPYGLTLFRRTIPLLMQGVDPEWGLRVHTLLLTLQDRLEKPEEVKGLIERYFLNNPHRVTLLLRPDPDELREEERLERLELDKIQEKLTPTEKEALIQQAQELAQRQEANESATIDCLPRITLDEVPKEPLHYPLSEERAANTTIHHHDCFTNEICYVSLVYDLPLLTQEELPYLRLMTTLLGEIGMGGRSYEETLNAIQLHTGGLGASLNLFPHLDPQPSLLSPAIIIEGKALRSQTAPFFSLMGELISSTDWSDRRRIKEYLLQLYSAIESSITHRALRYASGLVDAHLSPVGQLSQTLSGRPFLSFLRELMQNLDLNLLVDKLADLAERILQGPPRDIIISSSTNHYEEIRKNDFYGLPLLHEGTNHPSFVLPDLSPSSGSQGLLIASQVAFTAIGLPAPHYLHPLSPALSLAARLFDHLTLHRRVREQGGAYGVHARHNPLFGIFTFTAYRDPHLLLTLQACEEAIEQVIAGAFTERDLEEAKLSFLQKLDTPTAPGSRAFTTFELEQEGLTEKRRKNYRTALLTATPKQISEAVAAYLHPVWKERILISCANEELLSQENQKLIEAGENPLPLSPL